MFAVSGLRGRADQELRESKLPDRLQHAEAGPHFVIPFTQGAEQALVHQRCESGESSDLEPSHSLAHRVSRFDGTAAREHCQAAKERLFGRSEQGCSSRQ